MPAPRRVTLALPTLFPWQQDFRKTVLHSPARFILAVLGRRAGKTTGLTTIAGEDVALERKGRVFWGAPTYDLAFIAREIFGEHFGPVIRHRDNERPRDTLYGGGAMFWRSFDRPGGPLGRGWHLAVIEEAARVKGTQVLEELLPSIADTGGKIVAITTPRGQRHWTHDWYLKAKAGNPLYSVIHGPSTHNPMPAVQDFVAIARESMGEALYRQEILAEFLPGEGSVFRNIQACATQAVWLPKAPSAERVYVLGVDLAKHQDFTVCMAIDLATGQVHGMERWQHCPWPVTEERIYSFWKAWNRGMVYLDSTGVGDAIYDHLLLRGITMEAVTFSQPVKARLVTNLAVNLERQEITFPPDDVLLGELEGFGYEVGSTGTFRYGAPDGMYDDTVMALALAVWGRTYRNVGARWLDWMEGQAAGMKAGQ